MEVTRHAHRHRSRRAQRRSRRRPRTPTPRRSQTESPAAAAPSRTCTPRTAPTVCRRSLRNAMRCVRRAERSGASERALRRVTHSIVDRPTDRSSGLTSIENAGRRRPHERRHHGDERRRNERARAVLDEARQLVRDEQRRERRERRDERAQQLERRRHAGVRQQRVDDIRHLRQSDILGRSVRQARRWRPTARQEADPTRTHDD